MPFFAELDGEIVEPDDVDDDARPTCPECSGGMHVRRGHLTTHGVLKPRHFVHNRDAPVGGHCHGGESDPHKQMKYVTSRYLHQQFEHGELSRETEVPGTDRIGDTWVEFKEPIPPYGRGVVAETQYRNKTKDLQAVTREYLEAGFSVYWLSTDHFDDDYTTVELPDIVPAWPNAVPMPSQWGTDEEGYTEPPAFGRPARISVKMPPEWFEEHREELRATFKRGAALREFADHVEHLDLGYELGAKNAGRDCAICGDAADMYLFCDGVISTFRCHKCLPDGDWQKGARSGREKGGGD